MGFFTSGAFVGVVFVVFLSAIRFSFNIFARSLFSCPVFISILEFIFLSLFWPPSELGAGGKNSCPTSVFSMDVAFRVGMIPGVFLRVFLECILGAVLMLAFVVGVDDVCTLCSCIVSNFSVAVSKIFASCSKDFPFRLVRIFGSFNILCIAPVRYPAMRTALSIGVSFGAFT